jgi:5-methylcytosine-specific restriction endonuclease McrA
MEKLCARCKQVLDVSNFYTSKGKINGWCKKCFCAYTSDRAKTHPRKKELVNAANKRFYEKHKELSYANTVEWRNKNPERYKEITKNYYEANKGVITNRANKFYQDNKDRILRERKEYRINNVISIKEHKKKYNKEHRQEKQIRENYRRAKKRNNGGLYTVKEWVDLCNKYGNKCLRCNETGIKLTADHIVPISKGGNNNIENIQPLCASCNSIKNVQVIDYRY